MCLKVTEMRFTIGRSAAAGLLAVIKLRALLSLGDP
jgi:hypothetical protein